MRREEPDLPRAMRAGVPVLRSLTWTVGQPSQARLFRGIRIIHRSLVKIARTLPSCGPRAPAREINETAAIWIRLRTQWKQALHAGSGRRAARVSYPEV